MEKIKGLKKVSGAGEPKGKNLIDFISQPQVNADDEDTVPELDGETLSPLNMGVDLKTMEPGETSVEYVEPVEPPPIPPMTAIEGIETEVVDISQLDEAPEVVDVVELAEMTEATEIAEMAEIPEVGDVAAEIDSVAAQIAEPAEPYAEFYNEETVESVEEPAPVEETAPATTMGEPAAAAEFVTESAAELYLSQGLYDDALGIYEKLYAARKEGRFLLRVKQLRAHRVGREKIRRLGEFLKSIQMKGE
jgi:hypothetical protein